MNDRQGFTLIEIVMAVLIFAIMMGGLMSAGIVASNQLHEGQADVELWSVASYKMERLIAAGYDSVKNGKETIMGYDVDWKIKGNSPKTVTLTIDRKAYKGKEKKQQAFVTLLADPDDL